MVYKDNRVSTPSPARPPNRTEASAGPTNIRVHYDHITSDSQLKDFCSASQEASSIAFDTEFISEHTYRPQLCLLQVAVKDRLAVVDPQAVEDLSPFWQLLAGDGHESLAHAGREEFLFCFRSTGQRPHNLFDVQLAAGLVGMEYPASYGSLISQLLDKQLAKGETRTDWRRRPLSQHQLEYALQDVTYLRPLRDILHHRLEQMGRLNWMSEEMSAWQDGIEAYEQHEQWRRLSGISGLGQHALSIARELWRWRDDEAKRRDCPPRRVLRDDLIVELARRGSADPKRIRSLRGMERRDLDRHMSNIVSAIERAKSMPDKQLPTLRRRRAPRRLNLLGQFLNTALTSICRNVSIAPVLVGTVEDVRDLVAYRLELDEAPQQQPLLARGWRAEIVGSRIDQLLDGKLAIRVVDPHAEDPLIFEPRPDE